VENFSEVSGSESPLAMRVTANPLAIPEPSSLVAPDVQRDEVAADLETFVNPLQEENIEGESSQETKIAAPNISETTQPLQRVSPKDTPEISAELPAPQAQQVENSFDAAGLSDVTEPSNLLSEPLIRRSPEISPDVSPDEFSDKFPDTLPRSLPIQQQVELKAESSEAVSPSETISRSEEPQEIEDVALSPDSPQAAIALASNSIAAKVDSAEPVDLDPPRIQTKADGLDTGVENRGAIAFIPETASGEAVNEQEPPHQTSPQIQLQAHEPGVDSSLIDESQPPRNRVSLRNLISSAHQVDIGSTLQEKSIARTENSRTENAAITPTLEPEREERSMAPATETNELISLRSESPELPVDSPLEPGLELVQRQAEPPPLVEISKRDRVSSESVQRTSSDRVEGDSGAVEQDFQTEDILLAQKHVDELVLSRAEQGFTSESSAPSVADGLDVADGLELIQPKIELLQQTNEQVDEQPAIAPLQLAEDSPENASEDDGINEAIEPVQRLHEERESPSIQNSPSFNTQQHEEGKGIDHPAIAQLKPLGLSEPLTVTPALSSFIAQWQEQQQESTVSLRDESPSVQAAAEPSAEPPARSAAESSPESPPEFSSLPPPQPADSWSNIAELLGESPMVQEKAEPWQQQLDVQETTENFVNPWAIASVSQPVPSQPFSSTETVESGMVQAKETVPDNSGAPEVSAGQRMPVNAKVKDEELDALARVVYHLMRSCFVTDVADGCDRGANHPPWVDVVTIAHGKATEPEKSQKSELDYPPDPKLFNLTQTVYQNIQLRLETSRGRQGLIHTRY
jgi:hypothetical protein